MREGGVGRGDIASCSKETFWHLDLGRRWLFHHPALYPLCPRLPSLAQVVRAAEKDRPTMPATGQAVLGPSPEWQRAPLRARGSANPRGSWKRLAGGEKSILIPV